VFCNALESHYQTATLLAPAPCKAQSNIHELPPSALTKLHGCLSLLLPTLVPPTNDHRLVDAAGGVHHAWKYCVRHLGKFKYINSIVARMN
jgi:hypothetical protein